MSLIVTAQSLRARNRKVFGQGNVVCTSKGNNDKARFSDISEIEFWAGIFWPGHFYKQE